MGPGGGISVSLYPNNSYVDTKVHFKFVTSSEFTNLHFLFQIGDVIESRPPRRKRQAVIDHINLLDSSNPPSPDSSSSEGSSDQVGIYLVSPSPLFINAFSYSLTKIPIIPYLTKQWCVGVVFNSITFEILFFEVCIFKL